MGGYGGVPPIVKKLWKKIVLVLAIIIQKIR